MQTLSLDLSQFPQIPGLVPPITTLYARGNPSLLQRPCLAMVGSRQASPQGLLDAEAFAARVARQGLVVVSGLALGIDAAAHRGALMTGQTPAPTIAVLGHGLDQVYPRHHSGLAQAILEHGGLLLSEYPDGTPARPHQFPLRNRIIAGLCKTCLVIEAAVGSGSLITAMLAVEMGRDVYALPGSVHEPNSHGPHELIRMGAGLVRSPDELLADMGLIPRPRPPLRVRAAGARRLSVARADAQGPDGHQSQSGLFPRDDALDNLLASEMPADQAESLLRHLSPYPVALDWLSKASGLSTDALTTQLLVLELQGRVSRDPQGSWRLLVRA